MRTWVRGAMWCPLLCGAAALAHAEGDESLESVLVTGTRLKPATEQSAQPVRTYDRARIERSGQTTTADFLATVPEVSINSLESTYGATSIRLRGAREGSTLILINGRRTQAVTGDAALIGFFDLNTIPLAMVDHIDILPNGSSAIYGGEALAGVVNIVLRSEFDGVIASAGYKAANDTQENIYAVGAGWKGESANATIMASYTKRDGMSGADRAITANSDFRSVGGPNLATSFFGTPATIQSTSGNLPGLSSNVAAVPDGSSGVGLRPADFAATAGEQNYGSYNRYQDLVRPTERSGLFGSGAYRFDNDVELFAEIFASRFSDDGATSPSVLLQSTVPASNAFNPFGVNVRASGVVIGAEHLARVTLEEKLTRPLLGARGTLWSWEWEATGLFSRDEGTQEIYGRANSAPLNAALASSNPAAALNPFTDGPMGSPELLGSIFGGSTITRWKGDATLLNAFARGAVVKLPAGPLEAVIGAEYEDSSLTRNMDRNRNVAAGFTEVKIPLLRRLALSGAVRYDDYSDFGDQTTWQAGVEYRPAASVLLRATHGTAFKPPTLYNLAAPASSGGTPVIDPRRNRETVVAQGLSGGNDDLVPTTSDSSTLGVVWSPEHVAGLDISLTAWRLNIDGSITLPDPQYIVDNEDLYPGRVVRAPAAAGTVGSIVSVNRTYINFGAMQEEGFDAGVDWSWRTSAAGSLTTSVAATYMTKFEGASVPGGAVVDRLSRANSDGIFAPRLKGTASLGWSPGESIHTGLTGRYVGSYHDYTPTRTLGDCWYLDGSLEIGVGKLANSHGWLEGLKVFLTGTNLLDKMPPYSSHFRGYDIYNYDLIGRTIYLRLQIQP